MPSSIQFDPDPGPILEKHTVRPFDTSEDAWRCTCGKVFVSAQGYAVCPRADSNSPGTGSGPSRPHPSRTVKLKMWGYQKKAAGRPELDPNLVVLDEMTAYASGIMLGLPANTQYVEVIYEEQ